MKRLIIFATLFATLLRAADVPISGLPAASSVGANNLTVVVDLTDPTPSNQTKKANVSQLIQGLPAATPTSDGKMLAADKAKLDNATSANTPSTLVTRDGSGNIAAQTVTANKVTGLATPTGTSDAATKAYVDSVASGLNIHDPVAAATTANITLAGGAPSTLDGYTLSTNDRVLVKNQTDATQNGIYYVQTLGSGINGTWVRSTDADTGAELTTGSYVFVNNGTANGSTSWVMNTPGAITIGVSNINWGQFSKIGQIQASSIIGQIVQSQIADAAINFTKFANGIQPVSLVSVLPSPSGYTGPSVVYNTSDGKLYRYSGGAWTSAITSSDIPTAAITTTQIADNSISTSKLQANSVGASQIAANSIVAGDITSGAVTAGTIAAGAVSTTELAAGAITSAKIAAGTIVSSNIAALTITGANIAAGTISVDKLNVANLSAISANLGTVTAGTITTNVSISVGSSNSAVLIDNTGMQIAGGLIDFRANFGHPRVAVKGSGSYSGGLVQMNGYDGTVPPFFSASDGGSGLTTISGGTTTTQNLNLSAGTTLHAVYYDTVVQSFGSGTDQTFTVSVSGKPVAGFLQCSSDNGLTGKYDWDGSSSTTATFHVYRYDGTSFSGGPYRFSYVLIY